MQAGYVAPGIVGRWRRRTASAVDDREVDFMAKGYARIGEPLNLLSGGQEWFRQVFATADVPRGGDGLVLGATPWMGQLLRASQRRVIQADMSQVMLEFCAEQLIASGAADGGDVHLLHADWRELPGDVDGLGVVIGDNAQSFLRYPDDWAPMIDSLADRMRSGAWLVSRMLALPRHHRRRSIDEIVTHFLAGESINYTEVRTALLFAHIDLLTYAIPVESVLEAYEANGAAFDTLLAKFGGAADNDLVTVSKYRGSGAVYYAPPLDEILDVFRRRFRIRSVHFGPYSMAEYFPLVVAERS